VTRAEKLSLLPTCALALAATLTYAIDFAGLGIAPVAALIFAVGGTALLLRSAPSSPQDAAVDTAAWAGVVLFVFAVVVRLAWPLLLPPGRGPDLTHHLLLVDYIEQHGQLVHDRSLDGSMGEMAHYTPGAHLLAVLIARWLGTDGLRTFFPLLALCTALTAGYVFLIARRLPLPLPYAIAAVTLLFLPAQYFHGGFTHDGFLAQSAATFFAVAVWWALVAWDQDRSPVLLIAIAVLLVAVFLTWPIFVGPLVVVFVAMAIVPSGPSRPSRLLVLVPLLAVASIHLVGRWGWLAIVRTSGAVLEPGLSSLGWLLPLLMVIGFAICVRDRNARVSVILLMVIALQGLTLFVLATMRGAATPYMAFKMVYLAIYPAAILGGAALAKAEKKGAIGWIVAAVLMVAAVRPAATAPRTVPVVDLDLYRAGKWVRANIGRSCVDYLVADAQTAYWLHLAVLGNPRSSARMEEIDRYEPRTAVGPWLTGDGRGYAIADARVLPDEVRSRVAIEQQFGHAVVIKRPDAVTCR
jgi:hypothetical protein